MRLFSSPRSSRTSSRYRQAHFERLSAIGIESLESRLYLSATTISFQQLDLPRHTLKVVDPANLITTAVKNDLIRCGNYALDLVAGYVNWKGCLDAEIRINPAGDNPPPSLFNAVLQQTRNGNAWRNDTLAEMISGVDPKPTAADVGCNVYVGQDGVLRAYTRPMWFDPAPSPYEVPMVPAGLCDFIGVFTHEVFHGLGFQGSSQEFASHVVTTNGNDFFSGACTQAEVGGLLPLQPRKGTFSHDHYGNTDLPTNPIQSGLMFRWGNYERNRLDIGRLDLAVLKDLGVPIRSSVGLPKVDVLDYQKATVLASAPTLTAKTMAGSQVVLEWTRPAQSGKSPVTGFQLVCSVDGGVTWAKSEVVQGQSAVAVLPPVATPPLFRVAAITDYGYGFFSSATSALVPTAPSAPAGVAASSGNASATISWSAPADDGGSPITDYVVQYSSNSGDTWTTCNDATSSARSATVTGVTNGTSYVFRVAAVNAAGIGAYSTASRSVTPCSVPGIPISVTATPANGRVGLTWIAPAYDGGSPVTDYVIEYSSNVGKSWTAFSDGVSIATAATVAGLSNGTSYVFRVTAVNAAGASLPCPTAAPVVPNRFVPGLQLGAGLSNGATLSEATQPGGAVTVSGELGAAVYVSFTGTTAGVRDARKTVTKVFTGKGVGTTIPVTLTIADVNKIGDGTVYVVATQADTAGNQSEAAVRSLTLDTIAPRVMSVSAPASRTYRDGNVLRFILTYSEKVLVTGAPSLSLTLAGNGVRKVDYVSGTGTNALTFEYRIRVGDSARKGLTLAPVIAINGGRIRDFSDNNAVLLFNAPTLTRVAILGS